MNLKESIRRILRESIPPQVKRRSASFDESFIHYRDRYLEEYNFRNFNIFWGQLMEQALGTLYHAWFVNTVPDDEWEESERYVKYYLTDKYYNETKRMWENKQRNKLNESEDKDHTKLLKGIIDSSDIFDYKYFCGVDIITPEERSDQYNFLNKNKIPYLIKVYFVGGPNSEVWPRTQAIRNKELDLIEELHEYITSFVPFNIEMMGSHVNSCDGYKKLMKRKYTTDDLQESIRKVLREEDYSPAGKEITPNKIVIHKSNPMFRDKIIENGLKVRAGECYKIYVGYGVKCKPAIFATNSTNKRAWFDSTYDDDIWEINTEMIPDVKWYKDRHYESRSKHIVTFQDIPKEAITLKYKGTGSGDVEKWDKDSPNIVIESIKKILREELNVPQPGESSGKALSQDEMGNMDCDTDYLTIDEILDGRIQRIPYYQEVLQDVLNDDYSWGVTKKVVEYARYMKQNPKSLRNLPPIIVVNDVIQDGAHRISAIYLLQNYMDKNNPLWAEIELEVKFCYK